MSKKAYFLLGLIALISGALSVALLTRGHLWWDDFASYILQAKSILSGTMAEFVRRNAFTVAESSYPPGPVAYPWGFPLLLAPVYVLFGLNVLAFKLVNTLFYLLFLGIFFVLARTRLGAMESLILTAVLAFNPVLLAGHDLILSDIPFLFFSTLGLYLIEYLSRTPKSPDFGLPGLTTGLVIFYAFFIRTNGIFLLAPLAVSALLARWPDWKGALRQIALPVLTFAVLLLLQFAIFPAGQESYFSHFSMFTLVRFWDNIRYYLVELPPTFFGDLPGGGILYALLAVFYPLSLVTHLRRDLALHLYILLTLALFITWPERQGLRFIYPIIPLFLLFAFDGMKIAVEWLKSAYQAIGQRVVNLLWLGLALVFLGMSVNMARDNQAANREINGPFDPVSAQMFAFVREETSPESVIIFFKPRAMRLFTDRDAFMTERCEDLPKGDYLALSKKNEASGQISPEEALSCNPAVQLEDVFHNKRFAVYKINHRN